MININIGILGHVDSGKTSLSRVLSTTASTAAFDKSPQSQERGITLDLGFSSFILCDSGDNRHLDQKTIVTHTHDGSQPSSGYNITLVDCPGHASLIKTVISGSQIIDMMLLVIDVQKGIQTQTAECLVIADITQAPLIIVLNKIDTLDTNNHHHDDPDDATQTSKSQCIIRSKKAESIEKASRRISKSLQKTRFRDPIIIPISTASGQGIRELKQAILTQINQVVMRDNRLEEKRRLLSSSRRQLIVSIDHCFAIRGQGTVMTGTVIQGRLSQGDTICIPHLKLEKKVKSLQMFRRPVETAAAGDRIGISVSQMDPHLMERGLICSQQQTSDHLVRPAFALVARVSRIPYFKPSIRSKQHKFHLSLMNQTLMATILFFSQDNYQQKLVTDDRDSSSSFSPDTIYNYLHQLDSHNDGYDPSSSPSSLSTVFALMEFDSNQSVYAVPDSLLVASRLDAETSSTSCRLAFYGYVQHLYYNRDYRELGHLPKVTRDKRRQGVIERFSPDGHEAIIRGLLKRGSDINIFRGLKVQLTSGEDEEDPISTPSQLTTVTGVIESSFGQSGKIKVRVDNSPVAPEDRKQLTRAVLTFKKFIHHHHLPVIVS